MKIISQNDIHLRSTVPANRIDDYVTAEVKKFHQLLGWSTFYEAPILCGGDLFDAPNSGFRIYNPIQDLLKGHDVSILTVTGNHDLYYHNQETLKDTTLYALEGSGGIGILQGVSELEPLVCVHGIGWETEPTEPIPGHFNIFLAHISVFEDTVPFYWKGEGYTAKSLVNKYPGFDLYLCGDIHIPFVKDNVVVSGSMMRQGVDQIDYKPRAYLIETDTMEIRPLYYDIEPDVFVTPDKSVVEELDLSELVAALGQSATGKASFKRDCVSLAEGNEPVKKIIEEVLDVSTGR